MSTIIASNLAGPSSTGTAATLSSLNGGPIAGSRNRIINGDMRIDQRNAGASLLVTSGGHITDRFYVMASGGGTITGQRSTTAPAGFTNSLQCSVTTVDSSLVATDEYGIYQIIEGFNAADFGFGTAAAKTVTVSFWVRSSVTGTYGLAFKNSDISRSYPTTYSIASANTWEYKTITIPGDTSGTWLKDSGRGFEVHFSLGAGSSMLGTANAWVSANNNGGTGSTAWISNAAATFFLTGVQVETDTVATPFERRSYAAELALCQRYYFDYGTFHIGMYGGTNAQGDGAFPVQMRTTPTISYTNVSSIANQVTIWTGTNNSSTFASGGFGNSTSLRLVLDADTSFSSVNSTWLRAYNVKLSAEF
jgi:hypothetical protein